MPLCTAILLLRSQTIASLIGNILSVIRSFIRKLVFLLDLWYLKGHSRVSLVLFFLVFVQRTFYIQGLEEDNTISTEVTGEKIIHLIEIHFAANLNGMHLL